MKKMISCLIFFCFLSTSWAHELSVELDSQEKTTIEAHLTIPDNFYVTQQSLKNFLKSFDALDFYPQNQNARNYAETIEILYKPGLHLEGEKILENLLHHLINCVHQKKIQSAEIIKRKSSFEMFYHKLTFAFTYQRYGQSYLVYSQCILGKNDTLQITYTTRLRQEEKENITATIEKVEQFVSKSLSVEAGGQSF